MTVQEYLKNVRSLNAEQKYIIIVTNTRMYLPPGTLGSQPDTYLVPVNGVLGLGV